MLWARWPKGIGHRSGEKLNAEKQGRIGQEEEEENSNRKNEINCNWGFEENRLSSVRVLLLHPPPSSIPKTGRKIIRGERTDVLSLATRMYTLLLIKSLGMIKSRTITRGDWLWLRWRKSGTNTLRESNRKQYRRGNCLKCGRISIYNIDRRRWQQVRLLVTTESGKYL